jgi:hypothetical protein
VNVEKLKQLKAFILAEPRRYDQSFWMFGKESDVVKMQKPPCGTAACLAGSACLMEGWTPDYKCPDPDYSSDGQALSHVIKGKKREYISELARYILELTKDEAENLFSASCLGWGIRNANAYKMAKTPLGRAKAAAAEIDRLIAQEEES